VRRRRACGTGTGDELAGVRGVIGVPLEPQVYRRIESKDAEVVAVAGGAHCLLI